jgi:tRNA pseudouridine55 synthase
MGGILLVNKPADITSHDVVVEIRKLFHTKKVGHAGTLDPFATGLLLLCLDEATRIVEYLVNRDKEYVAVMKLGESTDTQDCTGHVLEKREIPSFSEDEISKTFAQFVGELSQVPPMFSARKVRGKRLYELARRGEVIERAAQNVRIYELEIFDITLPYIRFRVVCSKGTYIRTLAHDIGKSLGCCAHLSVLERTRIGQFSLKDAVSLEQLSQTVQQSDDTRFLIPVDEALGFLPAIEIDEPVAALLAHGTKVLLVVGDFKLREVQLDGRHLGGGAHRGEVQSDGRHLGGGAHRGDHDQEFRVYSATGRFIALARRRFTGTPDKPQWMLQPLKVFAKI